MSDLTYSIKEIIEAFRDETTEALERIETQTTKTNGRVTSLENSRLQIWTTIAVLLAIGGTVISLAIMAIDSKIKEGIDQALTAKYDITNE